MNSDHNQEKRWFFNPRDNRGALYSKVFLHGDNFAAVVDPLNTPAADMMRSEFYQTNTPGQSNEHLHEDFVDFVINTALYHRELDRPTQSGNQVETVRRNIVHEANNHATLQTNALKQSMQRRSLNADLGMVVNDLAGVAARTVVNWTPRANIGTVTRDIDSAVRRTVVTEINREILDAATNGNRVHSTVNNINDKNSADIRTVAYRSFMDALANNYLDKFNRNFATMANSSAAKALYDNVYSKWGNLSDGSKKFYRAMITPMKKVNNQWVPLGEDEFANPRVGDDNIRINLVKDTVGGDSTRFAATLPEVDGNVFGSLWYTNCNGQVEQVRLPAGKTPVLKFIYDAVYRHTGRGNCVDTGAVAIHGPLGPVAPIVNLKAPNRLATVGLRYFRINVDPFVRKRLRQVSQPQTAPMVDHHVANLLDANVWNRNTNNELERRDENGDVIGLDEALDRLTAKKDCYNTYVNSDGVEQCREYIFDCLLEDDGPGLSGCLNKLRSKEFFTVAVREINNIHPVVALKTLNKFGFYPPEEVTEVINGREVTLKKVMDVNKWLQNYMTKNFTDDNVRKAINGNDRLIAYLDLVVQYVNSNPAILNKGLNVQTGEMIGKYKPSKMCNDLGIPARREPKRGHALVNQVARLDNHLKTGYQRVGAKNPDWSVSVQTGRLSTPFGSAINPGAFGAPVTTGVFSMMGGGSASSQLSQPSVRSSQLIGNVLNALYNELANRNKRITDVDKQKISHRLNALAKEEEELLKTVRYIEEYNSLLDYFKDYNSQTLSEAHLHSLVERHRGLLKKQVKHGDELRQIVSALNEILKKDQGVSNERESWSGDAGQQLTL